MTDTPLPPVCPLCQAPQELYSRAYVDELIAEIERLREKLYGPTETDER
jgi:hypothetical protein